MSSKFRRNDRFKPADAKINLNEICTKKEPESCELRLCLRWRLPTLPLSQYHRRDKV